MPSILMPAASKAGGKCLATVPNVGFIPAPPPVQQLPMPFPSTAECAAADKTVDKVLFENKEVVVASSKIPNSKGDEAATKKGVVSGTSSKEVLFKGGSSKVFADGEKVVCQTTPTTHNGSNPNAPVGMQADPSQDKVSVAL